MKAKILSIIAITFVILTLLSGGAARETKKSYAYTNNTGQTFAGYSAYASGGTWTTKAPMSIPRDRAAAVALDGKVYVIGGTNSSGALASMEVYDPATNTWTTKASMPGPKSESGAAVANGRIYVVGPPDNRLYEYNPATNTWAIKAPLPATPAGPVAVASISGRIFVTFNVSGESRWRLYVYDPFQDTWERRSDHPDERRSIASLGVSNGMIYAVGGGIAGQTPQETTRIDRYDPGTDQWTVNAIPPMATRRTHLGATLPTIYGRMFVFGGWDGYTALADAEVYDPWTNTWSALPPMPTARYKAAYAAVGYKIYVIGGNWGGAGGHWLTTNEEFSLPEPAQPENPIVFVSGWDGHYYYEIFTMNPDGSHQLRITNDGCANWHPTWTPDGKRILFSTDCGGHRDIYSMNPDGSDWRRLTFTPGWDVAIAIRPFMSPDGRTIAFLQGLPPDNMHIWLMNSDGSNPRQLTTGPGTEDDTAIAWSPDSRQIVFRSTRSGNWQLWRINVDGTGLTQLTNLPSEAHDPAWSPDGSTIAFASQGEIMLMNPDGSNIRTLPGPGWEFRPAWSPDGTRLVYGSYRGDTSDIYSKKIDNTDERNLTNRPDSNEWDPAWARIVGSTTGAGRILLYGGATAQTVFGDLWQYDGNDWTEIAWSGSGPGNRNHHGMAFDERRGRVVVFGGHDGTKALGDTWEYSPATGTWTSVATAHKPSPRYDAEMVYDKRRGLIVLFGGTPGQYIFYNDTWEYDGTDWRQVTTAHSPPGALDGAMVYDEARGRVVLVTGWQAQGFGWVNETWEYDGTDWTYVTQAPSWRYNFALAYDSARQRVVLFGGYEHGGIGCGLGDTWEYDGQRWTRITTPHAPPGRCGHAMTYDPLKQRVVLFGGDVGGGNYYGDTWEYDGSDWYQVLTSHRPPGRVWASLTAVKGGTVVQPPRGTIIDITASPTNPQPGQRVNFTVYVRNDGGTGTLYIGGAVKGYPGSGQFCNTEWKSLYLSAGASGSVTLSWVVPSDASGSYGFRASSWASCWSGCEASPCYTEGCCSDRHHYLEKDNLFTVVQPPHTQKPWTFILYLDGDNNLYPYLDRAIRNLEAQPANPNVNVLVLFDGNRNNDSWRFLVQPGGNYTIGVNKWDMGELNMGDPQTLADFIIWARENYPAQHYYLAIANHGRGTSGVSWDDTNSRDYLSTSELRSALQTATNFGQWKIDVLHYDACLMALLENAYQVKDYANYLVASQNLGWAVFAYDAYARVQEQSAQSTIAPYEFATLVAKVTTSTTPRQLAVDVADAYFNHQAIQNYPRTISALDLSQAVTVRQAVDNLSTALRNNLSSIKTYIQNARSATQKFDSQDYERITDEDEYLDLYHFAQRVKQYIPNSDVQNAAQGVMNAINGGFVVAEHHQSGYYQSRSWGRIYWDLDNAHGVSIYFPRRSGSGDYNGYVSHQLFQFTSESVWDEFLVDYFGAPGLPPETPREPEFPPMLAPEYKVYLPLVLRNYR